MPPVEPKPRLTSKETIVQLQNYRVVAQRFDQGSDVYIIEYAVEDAMGNPSWRELNRITDIAYSRSLSIEDFLFKFFTDIHEGTL